jgi:hypothetical protein
MSNPIAVVAEAQADFDVAAKLIDETLLRTVEWVSETDIDTHRAYVGRTDDERFIRWNNIEVDRGHDFRRMVRGRFGRELPRHHVSLRILRIISDLLSASSDKGKTPPFIVIVKDTDNQDDVREVLREARNQYRESDVVIGMQHTELECWLIAAFDPQSADEQSRLDEICRGDGPGVGFDPRPQSERLTATKREYEKLSPKRVLRHLIGNDRSRRLDGLSRSCHQLLKDRGRGNGLADFLSDLEWRLVAAAFGERVENP